MSYQHSPEEVDLELWSQEHPDREPPKCQRYRIRIDKTRYVVQTDQMTGRELLQLADKTPPERYALYLRLRGGQKRRVQLAETVSFRTPGIERFLTIPLDQTEGDGPLRHQFQLPKTDEDYLAACGLSWETVAQGATQRVVISGFPVPDGYNHAEVSVSLQIMPAYPDTQIDMAYFSPALALRSGRPLRALTNASFDERPWQRWSRHRTRQNPWRPGVDGIETHLLLVRDWLEREVGSN